MTQTDISLIQGNFFNSNLIAYQSDNVTPLNLTGFSAPSGIVKWKYSQSGTAFINLNPVINTAYINGVVSISGITPISTPCGMMFYEISASNSTGVLSLIGGKCNVSPTLIF